MSMTEGTLTEILSTLPDEMLLDAGAGPQMVKEILTNLSDDPRSDEGTRWVVDRWAPFTAEELDAQGYRTGYLIVEVGAD
jgi:hypothetical protein